MKRTSAFPLLHAGAGVFRNLLVTASILSTVTALLFLPNGQVLAVPINWDGSVDGDWDTASNWDPNQVPTSADAVTIPTGSAIIGSIVNADALSVTISAAGELNLNGGTLTTGTFDYSAVGSTFNFNDGTLRVDGGLFDNGSADLIIDGADPNFLPTLEIVGGAMANILNSKFGVSQQGALSIQSGGTVMSTVISWTAPL